MEEEEPFIVTFPSDSLPVSEIEGPLAADSSSPPTAGSGSSGAATPYRPRRSSGLHRTRTAPAISVIRDLPPKDADASGGPARPEPGAGSPSGILKYASVLLIAYLSVGVLVYAVDPHGFTGVGTHRAVDALYFCIVTLCTIGYGDIAPLKPATKLFACAFVLVGFGLIDVLLTGALNYVLDVQERMVLTSARAGATAASYIFDAEKGRMRIRMKVGLAIGVVVLCIGVGALALCFLEDMDWMDAVYLSVMSVTTVGYGDRAFKTMPGRIFASFWLLFSTLAVARAFLFLAEARIDKRHRSIAKWVLERDVTVADLLAADLDRCGFISKSEFIICKLKEMGKVRDSDILLICNQFDKLDTNHTGKITHPDLLSASR